MPAQGLLTDRLKASDVPERYKGKTYNDLYLTGELEEIRKDYPELYARLKGE